MYHNRIREYRKRTGMNLEEMAQKVGISIGYLCHLERGTRKNPSTEVMDAISTVLQKSVVDIFFAEENEKKE